MDPRRWIGLVMKLQINRKRIKNENDHSNETKDDDTQKHDNKKLNDHSLVLSPLTYLEISRSYLARSYRRDVRIGMRIFSS